MTGARIVLADDHSLMLQGIRKLLEKKVDLVAAVGNGLALVRQSKKTKWM